MVEIFMKEYADGIFIVAREDGAREILKKEFTSLTAKDVMQKYVFPLMEKTPGTKDEYAELTWVVDRKMKMADDPKIFSRPD